jgi:hypothetical protein
MTAVEQLAIAAARSRSAADQLFVAVETARRSMFSAHEYSDLVEALAETRTACDELLDAEKGLDKLVTGIERELAEKARRADY